MRYCISSSGPWELRKRPISCCDFRTGCAIAHELLLANPDIAQTVLSVSPHLAEALFQLGLTDYGKASIDMALAIQEARADPPSTCCCRRA